MESEQSQNFNERLSQWVANQGFWFQIRYSMTGSGTKGTAMFHLLRMGFRLLLFLIVAAIGTWVYLVRTADSEKAREKLEAALEEGLSAEEIELDGFTRSQGSLTINHLACEGGNGTFFTALEARNIRCKAGILDGRFSGPWDVGTVAISRLDVELRAGADDAESAKLLADSLFGGSERVSIGTIDIADASLRWGYSERTRGSISNSALLVQRQGETMKLQFKGGTFSQNWLRNLNIVELVVLCDPGGLTFEKAEFRRDLGTVDFSGLKVEGGERPAVSGRMKVRRLDLADVLPAVVRTFLEGSISGDFRVFGSTNSSDGVGFDGEVTLDGQDVITFRKRLHLLQALSAVDFVRNYHRVDFREGSFKMKTTGGGMEIKDLSLVADDLLTLEGNMQVRLPTPEESTEGVAGGSPLFDMEESLLDGLPLNPVESDFTLRRAATASKNPGQPGAAFDRLNQDLEMRRLEAQAAERAARALRYEGLFKISVPPDSFERAPRLAEKFPVDPATGRIPMMVPIKGRIDEITFPQAEEIYQLGRR